jgi:cysteine desulfurase
VAHLTGNFTTEAPLSAGVREAISAAFDHGWADPKKLSQASHLAQGIRAAAIEEFASVLEVSPADVEILGEPSLIHHLSLGGFLRPGGYLYHSIVDVGRIRAVARAHQGEVTSMPVGSSGAIEIPQESNQESVISLQARNGETGIDQKLESWRGLAGKKVLDATREIPYSHLTTGMAAASFDAISWNGPAGIGALVIHDAPTFRYPLAHIAPIRVPGSYSLPLLVGAVTALREYKNLEARINDLRNSLSEKLSSITGITLVGEKSQSSRYLSIAIAGISAEEVLRTLIKSGISCDAGSACSPEDLAPSHVIAAMGYPTPGHMRFTIHPTTTQGDVDELVVELDKVLKKLGS